MESPPLLTLIAIATLIFGFIEIVTADPSQRRGLLRLVIVYVAFFAFGFAGGLAWPRVDHQHKPDAQQQAVEKTKKSKPKDLDLVIHTEYPSQTLAKSTEDGWAATLHPKPNPKTHKHPTPAFIRKTIEDTAPLSQGKVAEQFVGVPISWDGTLQGSSTRGKQVLIYVWSDDDLPSGVIQVPIELPKHNFLLQAKKGTRLHIEAVIASCGAFGVDLKDTSLIELRKD